MSQLMNEDAINYLFLKMAAHYNHYMPKSEASLNFMKQEYLRELESKEQEIVFNNLKNHIKESKYLPTIAELVKKPEKVESIFNRVPNPQKTMLMLKKQDEEERKMIGHELDHEAIAESKRKAFEKIAKAQADMEARKYREE